LNRKSVDAAQSLRPLIAVFTELQTYNFPTTALINSKLCAASKDSLFDTCATRTLTG